MSGFPTTKFERVAAIAVRVGQLENGAPPMTGIGAKPSMDFQEIAEREYEANLLPFASKLQFPPDASNYIRVVEKPLQNPPSQHFHDGPL